MLPPAVGEQAGAAQGAVAAPASAMAQAVTGVEAAAAPSGAEARLKLSFSAKSWVDIRDADGKRAYFGEGLANSTRTVTGTAPLHVYLSAANGVQLEINDRAVAIAPQFYSGGSARFEAGADGVLRQDPAGTPGAVRQPASVRTTRPHG